MLLINFFSFEHKSQMAKKRRIEPFHSIWILCKFEYNSPYEE